MTKLFGLLSEHHIGAVVVSDDGESVDGIVSERDVVRYLHTDGAAIMDAPVEQIMTAEVHTCSPEDVLDDLETAMTERRIRHVPVVVDGELHAIVSIGDVVKNRIDDLQSERDQSARTSRADRHGAQPPPGPRSRCPAPTGIQPRPGVPAYRGGMTADAIADGSEPEDTEQPREFTRLGEYRLVQRLGEGGMGVVHLGLDRHGRAVAVKVLRQHVAHDPDARAPRLQREVETLRRIRTPRVAPILDADVDGVTPYIVTRYVPGPALDDFVAERGPLAPADLHRVASGVAEALDTIHSAGIVHRDVKPGNVLLVDGDPVLIDFGIAHVADDIRLTLTGPSWARRATWRRRSSGVRTSPRRRTGGAGRRRRPSPPRGHRPSAAGR